ncbi:MAG: hypothetical protein IJT00_06755 [Lachnospiraceae bacterium]|nr:hypothetical protein [Lachnospiraceae bacterium]
MRRYDIIKRLKRVVIVLAGIAGAFALFMAGLTFIVRKGSGKSTVPDNKTGSSTTESLSGTREDNMSDVSSVLDGQNERRPDISALIERGRTDSIMADCAAGFSDTFCEMLRSRDQKRIMEILNREVIREHLYNIDEEAFLNKIYGDYQLLNKGAELLYVGNLPLSGGSGRLVKYVLAERKEGSAELEYDLENQKVMTMTLYFNDDLEVVSFLPFPEYSLDRYSGQYGLKRR